MTDTNDTEFHVDRRYRIEVAPDRTHGPDFGGCDVKLGDEFVCSHVDEVGHVWSTDVSFSGARAPMDSAGWEVALHDYIRLGYVVPVDDEVAT